jgi:hypothetical protein
MAVDKNKFKTVTQLVIDKLEGGYYNPNWHSSINKGDPRYSSSGETMFGIDRKAGGTLNDSVAGKQFWSIIDKNKNPQTWKWNYKGGALAPQLKDLTSEIMYPQYESLANRYLTPQTKAIVDNDNRLLFHFIYGAWNGSGWFKKFATDMNKAVASGVTNTDKLTEVALNSRTKEGLKEGSSPNSLIAQGGNKIAGFINTLKDVATKSTEVAKQGAEIVKKNLTPTILITTALLVGSYILYKTLKQK